MDDSQDNYNWLENPLGLTVGTLVRASMQQAPRPRFIAKEMKEDDGFPPEIIVERRIGHAKTYWLGYTPDGFLMTFDELGWNP